jgi:hypothetical protein
VPTCPPFHPSLPPADDLLYNPLSVLLLGFMLGVGAALTAVAVAGARRQRAAAAAAEAAKRARIDAWLRGGAGGAGRAAARSGPSAGSGAVTPRSVAPGPPCAGDAQGPETPGGTLTWVTTAASRIMDWVHAPASVAAGRQAPPARAARPPSTTSAALTLAAQRLAEWAQATTSMAVAAGRSRPSSRASSTTGAGPPTGASTPLGGGAPAAHAAHHRGSPRGGQHQHGAQGPQGGGPPTRLQRSVSERAHSAGERLPVPRAAAGGRSPPDASAYRTAAPHSLWPGPAGALFGFAQPAAASPRRGASRASLPPADDDDPPSPNLVCRAHECVYVCVGRWGGSGPRPHGPAAGG